MEKTLFCQDNHYQSCLRAVKEAARGGETTAIAEEGTAIAETAFHLEAYFKVSYMALLNIFTQK